MVPLSPELTELEEVVADKLSFVAAALTELEELLQDIAMMQKDERIINNFFILLFFWDYVLSFCVI